MGANAASAYLAYARGDPLAASKYTGRTAEAAIGTQQLRKIHGGIKDKMGEKNYNMVYNSYKAGSHGVALGYNLAKLNSSAGAFKDVQSAGNAAKLGIAGYKTATAAHKAVTHIADVHAKSNVTQTTQPIITQGSIKKPPVIGGTSRRPTTY